MHILTVNILEMVKDVEILLLPSNNKSCMGSQLKYLHLTLTHSKGQSQGHGHFTIDYLAMVQDRET